VPRVSARDRRAKSRAASLIALRDSKLRLLGVALICAKLALVPVVIDPVSDLPFIVPKVLISHGLSYVLAGVLVALGAQFGRQLILWSWLHVPVAAFLIANVAATMIAENSTLALYGTHARMLGLGSLADGVLLYVATVLLVHRRSEVIAVVASLLAASIVVFVYELVQLADRDPFSWSFDGSVSPFSTLGQPTTLAFYLTIIALSVFALGVSIKELNRYSRAGLIAYSVCLVAGIAATGTRSPLVGVAIGGALLVLLLWLRQTTLRAHAVTALSVLAATATLVFATFVSPLGARLTTTFQTPSAEQTDDALTRLDPSSVSRIALYGIALEMLRERPLLGYGPDNFSAGVPTHRPEGAPPPIRQSVASSAHSWLAYVGTSSGVVGLTSFGAIIVSTLLVALRSRAHALVPTAAAALGAYLGTGLTSVTDVTTDALFWLSIGCVAAVHARPFWSADQSRGSSTKPRSAHGGSWLASGIGVLAVAIGITLLVATARAADASRAARASQDSRLVRAVPQAIEAGLRATNLDPGRAEYWSQLGLAYVGSSRWPEAGAAFERARTLAPHDVRHISDLIAVHLVLLGTGEAASRSKAVELADQAVRTDPNNPGAQLTRATAMQTTGNLAEATRSVERALILDPQSTNERLYGTAAQIYLAIAQPADAVRVARQGRAILGVTQTPALGLELARALLANGQPREALTEIDLVLSLQPNYPAAERLRAEITARLGS
jgi:O-antigen ligase/tetratricopeptide (TPR) repeat protein